MTQPGVQVLFLCGKVGMIQQLAVDQGKPCTEVIEDCT